MAVGFNRQQSELMRGTAIGFPPTHQPGGRLQGRLGMGGPPIAQSTLTNIGQCVEYRRLLSGTELQTFAQAAVEKIDGGMYAFHDWIMYETLPMGSAATIEDVRVYANTISARTEYVDRGSLRGLHCYQVNTGKLGIRGGADAEMEIFLVGGKLLITAYIPGTSKASANGRTVSEAAKNRSQRMDNAAASFASLKPTGS